MTPGDRLHAAFKAGAKQRRDGTPTPYPARGLLSQVSTYGWVQEDLRLALMKADPAYRKGQEQHAVIDGTAIKT